MATRTARPFSALPATTQDARVRKAFEAGAIVTLASGDPEEAAALTMALELPESELPAVAEALNRIAESRREYEELCAVPLSERTAKQNARIRTLGNRWENTAAGSGRAPGEPETEDTIVQIRGKDGEWTDYARTTRREALATLATGHLPGSEREELRAVDWITKEEIQPAKVEPVSVVHRTTAPNRQSFPAGANGTRKFNQAMIQFRAALVAERTEEPAEVEPVSVVHESASKLPSTKEQRERIEALYDSRQVAEEKKRAPENFSKLGAARWINLLESHPLKEEGESEEQKAERQKAKAVRDADLAAKKRSEAKPRGRRSVTTNHVQPQEPDYAKMPARSRPKAKRDYQAALAAWKAAEESAAETTIEKAKKPAAPKASTARRGPATSSDTFDPSDPATRAEVVRLHTDDKLSMKAIAEKFGLPAVHKSWLAVSIVWREEADTRGLSRPRYPERSKK